MNTYKELSFCAQAQTVCALGCFDGVHIGHASIINEAKRVSCLLSLPLAVWSFAEPPRNYFLADKIPLLSSEAEKRSLMQQLGVDILVSVKFSKVIASMSALDFFENILIGQMKVKHVVCGFNYRFGKNGEGDTALLERLCAKHGIGISIMPPVELNGKTVSSSEIRALLLEGNIALANRYLGRPYSIRAKVINGQHLGRALGFPTLNQSYPKKKLVVARGVYLSRVLINKRVFYGITNVGYKPTVNGTTLCAETNVFDFNSNAYGKTVTVQLLEFIRAEKRFSSVELLSEQVRKDIEVAKKILKGVSHLAQNKNTQSNKG